MNATESTDRDESEKQAATLFEFVYILESTDSNSDPSNI